jgi:hypothetical protein
MKWNSDSHRDGVRFRLKAKLQLASLDKEEVAFLLERLDQAAAGNPAAIWNMRSELHDLGLPREPQA